MQQAWFLLHASHVRNRVNWFLFPSRQIIDGAYNWGYPIIIQVCCIQYQLGLFSVHPTLTVRVAGLSMTSANRPTPSRRWKNLYLLPGLVRGMVCRVPENGRTKEGRALVSARA